MVLTGLANWSAKRDNLQFLGLVALHPSNMSVQPFTMELSQRTVTRSRHTSSVTGSARMSVTV